MSKAQSKPDSNSPEYPFHTGELPDSELPDGYHDHWDGLDNPNEIAGLAFRPKQGRIYEFQDPSTHDDYERLVDPKDGDVLTFDSAIGQIWRGDCLMELVKIPFPAERWAEIRSEYVEQSEWSDAWQEATPSFKEHCEDLSREATKKNIEERGGW
jgi:hypothetical protein